MVGNVSLGGDTCVEGVEHVEGSEGLIGFLFEIDTTIQPAIG